MKTKGVCLAACLTAILCISSSLLAYSGGNGTPANPYKIANVADFLQLSATPADWVNDKSFILTANIDLSDNPFTQAPIAPDTDHSDYWDFQGPSFHGIFDGNGHTISNLTITSTQDFVGLVGLLNDHGQIRNLGVVNVKITGRNYVGGMVGCNSAGSLTACYATGSVTGTDYYAGGLVGKIWIVPGALTACYATCTVNGTERVGGLVGDTWGTLTACYATGPVTGRANVGGLAGEDRSTITACFATGTVKGNSDVGGLVGFHCYAALFNSYATGSVSGNSHVGGLVGMQNLSSITNCYATGSVRGIDQNNNLGGLLGFDWGTPPTGCYWDMEASGINYSAGGTGMTTAQMKKKASFIGWDFSGEMADGSADIWRMCVDNAAYPRLSWEFSQGGDMICPNGVGIEDLQYFAWRWTDNTPASAGAADINSDGKVDMADLAILSAHWLQE
jgi:hypothetical protein